MCWVCDQDKSLVRESWLSSFGGNPSGGWLGAVHFGQRYDGRYLAEAFPADGVGDSRSDPLLPTAEDLAAALLVLDDVPGDRSTTHSLTVGGPSIISTINLPGDEDFFRVELEAGVTYESVSI